MSDLQHARILIVKLSAIGDVIHALPMVTALRRYLPGAHLSWAVEGRTGDLLQGHPDLDEVVVLPRRWLNSPVKVWQARRQLKALRPDIVIDAQGLARSAIAGWFAGARRRIGFASVAARELSYCTYHDRVTPQKVHIVERNLELLAPLGITDPQVEFRLPRWPVEGAQMHSWMVQKHLQHGFLVLNPGAGWPSKRWSLERFATVARQLFRSHGLPSVVVWGGEEEESWAHSIVEQTSGLVVMAPSTTLRQLAELLRSARLMVSADTGPLHLAVAVGTPCVGLFGPMPAERNGPYGPGHIALQKECLQGSSRSRRNADNAAMLKISVEDVLGACQGLLKQQAAA